MKGKISAVIILIAGILWGSSCLFVDRLTSMGFNSFECVAIRLIFAAVITNIMLIVKGKGFKYYKISLSAYLLSALTGVCSVFAMCLFYYSAMIETSAAVSAILLYTSPIFVMILSLIFFKEKLSTLRIVAFVIAIVGCVLVSGISSGVQISTKGFIFGLLAGFTYSLYGILTVFYMKKNTERLAFSAHSFVFAGIATLFTVEPSSMVQKVIDADGAIPLTILFFALFSLVTAALPFVLYAYGLSGVKPSTASILAFIEPLTAAFLGFFVLHQSMDIWGGIGFALIVVAIVVLNCEKTKN